MSGDGTFSNLTRSLAAFVMVGIAATLTHVVVGLSIVEFGGVQPFNANIVAFLVAFGVSYVGHHRYTFRSRASHSRALPKFFAVAALGLGLNQIIVYLWVNVLGGQYAVALAMVVTVVPAVVYVIGRFWAFREDLE